MTTKNNNERMLKDIKSEIERYIRQCEDTISHAMNYVATEYDYFFRWYAIEVFINTERVKYFKAMLKESDFKNAEVLEAQISNRITNCERAILNTPLLETRTDELRTIADRLEIESKRSILKELNYVNLNFANQERE